MISAARFCPFGIASLTRWAKSPEPMATREGRPRKVDLEKLAQDVRDHPDAYQYERAARFGVTPKAIVLPQKLAPMLCCGQVSLARQPRNRFSVEVEYPF
ncbi:IS630 transposase-related protein [Paracoccus sp. (in: a-proteobacteria)]|uniref:IS630 transposase-related protein n=1 Tax=Paracoccus sp. TaxID=267 RepID=UPI003A88D130